MQNIRRNFHLYLFSTACTIFPFLTFFLLLQSLRRTGGRRIIFKAQHYFSLQLQIIRDSKLPSCRHSFQQRLFNPQRIIQRLHTLCQQLSQLFIIKRHISLIIQSPNRFQLLMKISGTGTNPFLQLLIRRIILTLMYQPGILIAETLRHLHNLLFNMGSQRLIFSQLLRKELIQILIHKTKQPFISLIDRIEIKQITQQIKEIRLLHIIQLLAARLILLHRFGEIIHRSITYYGFPAQRRLQHHTLQRLATTQSHVSLSMCKGIPCINNSTFKRQTLTLMYRNSPRQTNRILAERPLYHFSDLLRLLIQHILIIPPLFRQQLKFGSIPFTTHHNTRFINRYHLTNHTVIIPFLGRWIILQEHNLCSLLNCQKFIRRIRIFWKIPLYLGTKMIRLAGQRCQFAIINPLCLIIMCRQTNISLFFLRLKAGLITTVQFIQHFIIRLILPNFI